MGLALLFGLFFFGLLTGMPVAFAVHICKFPKFESKKSLESAATKSASALHQ